VEDVQVENESGDEEASTAPSSNTLRRLVFLSTGYILFVFLFFSPAHTMHATRLSPLSHFFLTLRLSVCLPRERSRPVCDVRLPAANVSRVAGLCLALALIWDGTVSCAQSWLMRARSPSCVLKFNWNSIAQCIREGDAENLSSGTVPRRESYRSHFRYTLKDFAAAISFSQGLSPAV
jgi:hypothetical protein